MEFPGDGGCTAADHYTLMQEVYGAVKAKGPGYVVMFGVSPGYYIAQYEWDSLDTYSDYAFTIGGTRQTGPWLIQVLINLLPEEVI